jgi:hypothetical protein
MSKNDEIQILREAVTKLTLNSYCGPWLESVIAEVEAEVRCDFLPSPSIARSEVECRRLVGTAREEANQIIQSAREAAEKIKLEARARAREILSTAVYKLAAMKHEIKD